MISFAATRNELIDIIFGASIWLTAGVLIGAFHFLTLQKNVRILVAGQSLLLPLGVQLIRFALTAGVLAAIARSFRESPLLFTAAGILVTRMVVIRRGVRL